MKLINELPYLMFFLCLYLLFDKWLFRGNLSGLIGSGIAGRIRSLGKKLRRKGRAVAGRPADWRQILDTKPYSSGQERTGADISEKSTKTAGDGDTLAADTGNAPTEGAGRPTQTDSDRASEDVEAGPDDGQRNLEDDTIRFDEAENPDTESISMGNPYDELKAFTGITASSRKPKPQSPAAEPPRPPTIWELMAGKIAAAGAVMRDRIEKIETEGAVPDETGAAADTPTSSDGFSLKDFM